MLKFKSREELLKKKLRIMDECSDSDRDGSWNNGISIGINDAFESFAERVELYKKYHVPNTYSTGDYKYKLEKYHPKLFKLFWQSQKNKYHIVTESWHLSGKSSGATKQDFNVWLFDYCFGDM